MDDDINALRTQLIDKRVMVGGYRAFAERADLSRSWVYKFVEGHIEEPRKKNLKKVRDTLAAFESESAMPPQAVVATV